MTYTGFSNLNKDDVVVKPGTIDKQAPASREPRRSPEELQTRLTKKLYTRGAAFDPKKRQARSEEPPSVF